MTGTVGKAVRTGLWFRWIATAHSLFEDTCTMTSDTDARLEKLETDLAHAQLAIDELNDVVTRQAGQIDLLTRKLAALEDHMDELEDASARNAPGVKPPHY